MKNIKQYKYIILVALIIFGVAFLCFKLGTEQNKEEVTANNSDVDIEKALEAIKKIESELPSRIGKSPTAEEIYSSPYIQHIRTALNGYVEGTNNGVEDVALNSTTNQINKCGLNSFNKSDFKSKFIVIDAFDNDYGGVEAYIAFIDKPDIIFWVWIYRLGSWSDENKKYVLRTLCEKSNLEESTIKIFKDYLDVIIKNSDYYL